MVKSFWIINKRRVSPGTALTGFPTMSIDEYVIGKDSKLLCYALEGKIQNLFLGISGSSASKFGIYWNKNNKYKDQANNEISELISDFQIKSDLYEIIKEGIH